MDEQLLNDVKALLFISGNFHDNALKILINGVLDYMTGAGVAADVARSRPDIVAAIVGEQLKGGVGKITISDFYRQQIIQLAFRQGGGES